MVDRPESFVAFEKFLEGAFGLKIHFRQEESGHVLSLEL